jgi:hypothetical protein
LNNPDYHQRQIVWSGPETGGCQLRMHPEPTGQRRAIITEAERTARHVGPAGRLLKIAVTHLQELEHQMVHHHRVTPALTSITICCSTMMPPPE